VTRSRSSGADDADPQAQADLTRPPVPVRLDFAEITKTTPERSLVKPKPRTGGRNAYGRMTARHRVVGHKRQYRVVDFRRNKDGVPAKVAAIEYDPNRNAPDRAAPLPRRREALHPRPERRGGRRHAAERPGCGDPSRQRAAAALHPGRDRVHNVELKPGAGGKMGRGAGAAIQLVAKEGQFATLRLPSTEMRRVPIDCRATVGSVGNSESALISIGKAGRNRWKGKRPHVRGVAMNPVDHPLGGGEGKTSGGRHPVSPWASPRAGPRKKGKKSDQMIVRRRRSRGSRR
jgi:large subunit ribosomal protein L2